MDSGNSGENDASMQIAYSGRITQWIYISFFLHYFLLLVQKNNVVHYTMHSRYLSRFHCIVLPTIIVQGCA